MDSLSDIDLINLRECRATDDAQAFVAIYERYWQRLFAIAFHRLEDRSEAEDVVHDVFLSLWAHRRDQSIEQLEHYLAAATKYAVLARIRNRRKRAALLRGRGAPTIGESSTGEERLDQKLLLERLHMEVERLPARCRLIFQCSREQGMPVRDIAAALQISPRTVEHQLSKALRQLRFAMRSLTTFFC